MKSHTQKGGECDGGRRHCRGSIRCQLVATHLIYQCIISIAKTACNLYRTTPRLFFHALNIQKVINAYVLATPEFRKKMAALTD